MLSLLRSHGLILHMGPLGLGLTRLGFRRHSGPFQLLTVATVRCRQEPPTTSSSRLKYTVHLPTRVRTDSKGPAIMMI